MAKILDSNVINAPIQKVVETPLGYIMNAHYYDKTEGIPKPLQVFPVTGDIVDLSMSQKLMLGFNTAIHPKTSGDTIVVDNNDSTICYVWVSYTRSNSTSLYKIQEQNETVSIVTSKVYSALPTTDPTVGCYCGQDDNYVYYIIHCYPYNDYFVKIDKVALTLTSIESMGSYSWGSFITETNTHIYFSERETYGLTYIKRYNKITSTLENFNVTPRTSSGMYYLANTSEIQKISDTNFYFYTVYYDTTAAAFKICRYTFDLTQPSLTTMYTEAVCNITWNSTITQIPKFASNTNLHYELFTTKASNGNTYLNLAVWEPVVSTVANTSQYGIYTFLIDGTSHDLTFKTFLQVTSDCFKGFIGVNNNTFLVGASPTTCYFMDFDVTTEGFIITDSLANQPSHIGADQSNNIWIENLLHEVNLYSPNVSTNTDIKFEKDSYKYEGTNITSYITIESKNFTGTDISTNLQLTLKGNALFTSNNSKILTDTTLTTGPKQIPIVINGAGNIYIEPILKQ